MKMEVRVKIEPLDKCSTCGHPANHHIARTGRCVVVCTCTQFKPYEPQLVKELRWIFHNFTIAKTDAEKTKWKDKLFRWGKAHPTEYNAFLKDMVGELERRM